MAQTVANRLEVDPNRGIDQPSGRPHLPYKSLTAALVVAQGPTLIVLAPGTYSAASGERFPITIGEGVMVIGQEANQGQGIIISGGGSVPGRGESVAVVLTGTGQLRGVTVQNPQGIGLLVTEGSPLVRSCRLTQGTGAGGHLGGRSMPQIVRCQIEAIQGSGLRFTEQAKGEVRDCTIQRCDQGITLNDQAAPLVIATQCSNNQVGVATRGSASPVLRQTRLIQNQRLGLWLQQQGRPDLGQGTDGGHNILRYNGEADLRNDTAQTLSVVDNDLLPQRLMGAITLAPSQLPDPVAVPPVLLDQPVSPPPPAASSPPRLSPPPALASRFPDLHGHWATPYIEAMADRGLIKGYDDGSFRPQQAVTRAQFAALVATSYGDVRPVRPGITFVDVPPSHWAYRAIDLAQRRGFLGGYPDQTFRPDQPMARVQGIVAVASGLGLGAAPASVLGQYRDRSQIPSYAIGAVAAASQQNLVINYPDPEQLRPQAAMTRAEVAALIYQGLVAQGQAPALAVDQDGQGSGDRPLGSHGSFPDIQGHWAKDYIHGLLSQALVSGHEDGRFYPDQAMARAQFAALISQGFAPAPQRPAIEFRDVPPNHWAAAAIQRAYRGGLVSGFPDQSFAPDHPMLRVQVWVALVNGLNLGNQGDPPLAVLDQYRDRHQIPNYALGAVAIAVDLGLVVLPTEPDRLQPNRVASRADVAAAMYQTLVQQRRLPPL
jgi:hypothetical protein